jgi:hypothetical protein
MTIKYCKEDKYGQANRPFCKHYELREKQLELVVLNKKTKKELTTKLSCVANKMEQVVKFK